MQIMFTPPTLKSMETKQSFERLVSMFSSSVLKGVFQKRQISIII